MQRSTPSHQQRAPAGAPPMLRNSLTPLVLLGLLLSLLLLAGSPVTAVSLNADSTLGALDRKGAAGGIVSGTGSDNLAVTAFESSDVPVAATGADLPLRGGGGRVLLQGPRRPPAIYFEKLPFDAPIITIALTQVPTAGQRSRKYFAYWRAFNRTQDKSAATFDLDTHQSSLLTTRFDHFCNGPVVLPDGSPAVFGGFDVGNRLQRDGRRVISIYNQTTNTLDAVGRMVFPRWYPTTCVTADNKVLIVGGTAEGDKGPKLPVAELWDPAKPGAGTVPVIMPPTFFVSSWYNWYPFIALLPGGHILWWGDRGGSVTDASWKEIYKMPPLPPSFPYRTMYWYTSSIVLHALKPDRRTGEYNSFSFTVFGGVLPQGDHTTPAGSSSARLDMSYCGGGRICDRGWVIEDMAGQRRVMSTTTVLPNGKVLIHGGGQVGRAGWRKNLSSRQRQVYMGTHPAWRDLMYDPDAPLGSRYSLGDTLGIIHMYHASSCLDLSGKVLSSGCETCGMTGALAGDLPASVSRSPNGDYDYRLTFAVPHEIAAPVARPVIVNAPRIIRRGSTFNVTFRYGDRITGATLAAPCSNTHSINMNQRVLMLNVASAANDVAAIRAPPLSQPGAAHSGYYLLFLLGRNETTGRTYSEGVWVNLVDR